MGVVPKYETIQQKRVIIIGVGGIGSVAAEMLVRCGIGELVLFDYDQVEEANMNRMFYMPAQIGQSKVVAAKSTLQQITPNTNIICHEGNICSTEWYKVLIHELSSTTCPLLLCCVDNYAARLTINRACMETNTVWMESGVSETAMSGHIQTMIPGRSACFECAIPTIVAEGGDELKDIKREGVCTASIPTTMSIVAGLLVQNALKYLLKFGDICDGCLGYDALRDFFPIYEMKPNPECGNEQCRHRQLQMLDRNDPVEKPSSNHVDTVLTVSRENEWGIEVVDDMPDDPQTEPLVAPVPGDSNLSELINRLRLAHNK